MLLGTNVLAQTKKTPSSKKANIKIEKEKKAPKLLATKKTTIKTLVKDSTNKVINSLNNKDIEKTSTIITLNFADSNAVKLANEAQINKANNVKPNQKIDDVVNKISDTKNSNIDSSKISSTSKNTDSQKAKPIITKTKLRPITAISMDSSKIAKKRPTFNNTNGPKSAQDPYALNLNGFRVSKDLYGDYAPIIYDYVKAYHNNFGNYLGKIRQNNKGYIAMIDNAMRKNGIPKEFRSLAVIESGLNPNAVSPVGAVGPWQFMKPTAEMLGLRVDETVDERRDFYKSTFAAARFCKKLHNMFHDWLLVVASYNCGPSPVIRHLQRTGGNSFWDIKQFLPKETQNHVMAFIATSAYFDRNTKVLDLGGTPKEAALAYAKIKAAEIKAKDIAKAKLAAQKAATAKSLAAKNKPLAKPVASTDDDNDLAIDTANPEITSFDPDAPLFLEGELSQVVILKVKGAYTLESISEHLDFDITRLKRWNPNFNKLASQNMGLVKLVLPTQTLEAFLITKEKILQQSIMNPRGNSNNETVSAKLKAAQVSPKTNTGVTKDSSKAKPSVALKPIDKKLENEQAKIENEKAKKENKMVLLEKQNLNTSIDSTNNKTAINSSTKTLSKKKYVVKKGDNLVEIAETFGLTVTRICELNKLKSTTTAVKPGHTLYLE